MIHPTWKLCECSRSLSSSWTCWQKRTTTLWSLELVGIAVRLQCNIYCCYNLFTWINNVWNHTGGLCNLSMEHESRDQILQSGGVPLVISCLSSNRDETVLSAITTLMNLTTAASRTETTDSAVVQCMLRFSLTQNPRLRNLASVFLQDYCTQEQVDRAREGMQGQSQSVVGIPLPKDWLLISYVIVPEQLKMFKLCNLRLFWKIKPYFLNKSCLGLNMYIHTHYMYIII